jgi:hypothetical protein
MILHVVDDVYLKEKYYDDSTTFPLGRDNADEKDAAKNMSDLTGDASEVQIKQRQY